MSCRCFFADPPNCSQITLWNKIEAPAKWWCDSPGRGWKPAKIQCYINNVPHKTKQTKTAICQIIYTILRPGSVVNEWCVFSATQWNFRIFTSNLQDHQNGGIHPFYGSFNVTKVIKKGIHGIWGNRLLPHAKCAHPFHWVPDYKHGMSAHFYLNEQTLTTCTAKGICVDILSYHVMYWK